MSWLKKLSFYQWISLCFAFVIICIIGYSAIYSTIRNGYSLSCMYVENFGVECPSCGMSRAFSLILNGDFNTAHTLNNNALSLFGFLLLQLFLRLTTVFLYNKKRALLIKRTDALVSIISFVILFGPFILEWVSFFRFLTQ